MSIRPTTAVPRPTKIDSAQQRKEERNDYIDDTILRRMQSDLEEISQSFQKGEMQAFGRKSKDIFRSLDSIRDMQEKLASQHIALELQAANEVRPTPETMASFLVLQSEQERKMEAVLENLSLVKVEMETLQANFSNLE